MTDEIFDRLEAELRTHREALRAAFERIPAAMREVRPSNDRWSAAETVHHLSLVESMIAGMLEKFVAEAAPRTASRDLPEIKDLSRIAGRTRRVGAVPGSEPEQEIAADEAWSRLSAARERTLEAVQKVRAHDVDGMTYPHPLIGPLDAREWISFIGWHELRHANQIVEIAEQLEAP